MAEHLRGIFLGCVLVLSLAAARLHAQERLCADGTRSQGGICAAEANNSRVPDTKPRLKLAPCPDKQWFREWHMCHVREELGGGVVLDADFRNGAVYDPSAPPAQNVNYTFIDKFDQELEVGPLNLEGASVYVNFADVQREGTVRRVKVLVNFDRNHPFMVSRRIGVDSLLLPVHIQCKSRTIRAQGKVVGFIGSMGSGYPVTIANNPADASEEIKESDIQRASVENGDAALQVSRVVANVLNSVCKT